MKISNILKIVGIIFCILMIAIGNKYTESKDLVLPTVEEKYLNDLKDYSIATLESLRNKYKEIHCVEVSGSRYVTPNINDPWFFRNQNGNWKGFKGYYPDSNENREIAYQHDFRINCSGDCTIGAGGKLIPGYSVACDPAYQLGTKFRIDDRIFECMDRGGKVKDNLRHGKFALDFYIEKENWYSFEKYLHSTACFFN